jgi:hypothetical protein
MATKNTRKSGNNAKTLKDLNPKQIVKGGKVSMQDFHF